MILFVRHGETSFNAAGITQGRLDIPLNQTGIAQARQLARLLRGYPLDEIISSPLRRARATAQIIACGQRCPVRYDPRFIEYGAGRREGTNFRHWPICLRQAFIEHPQWFEAEDDLSFYERVRDGYQELARRNKNCLLVSHGCVYRNIYRYLHGITDLKTRFPVPANGQILVLQP